MEKTTCAFYEENIKYLRNFLGNEAVDSYLKAKRKLGEMGIITYEESRQYTTVLECLKQMEEFGDNRWWESDDKRVIAYYQVMTPPFLVSFSKFLEALEFLLGRTVWISELWCNRGGLKTECERAFNEESDSNK